MNSRNQLLTYLFALAGGVLLLIFNANPGLYGTIVITIGVLFLVASGYQLLVALVPSKTRQSNAAMRATALLPAVAGAVFGLLLVCMPHFFVQFIVFTFAITLFILGIVQLVSIISLIRTFGLTSWLLAAPILTIVAGVVCLLLTNEQFSSAVTLLTGIVLVIYGLNGFFGYAGRSRHAAVLTAAKDPEREGAALIESRSEEEKPSNSEQ